MTAFFSSPDFHGEILICEEAQNLKPTVFCYNIDKSSPTDRSAPKTARKE
jgi:hypothetical protein